MSKATNPKEHNPIVIAEWHPTKNGDLKPSDVTRGSDRKVWWLCKEGHEWETSVNIRTRGSRCPYCTGRYVLSGKNDLQTYNPKLASEWHPTKNGDLTPSDVTKGSSKKVWWICNKGHEWETRISNRSVDNKKCPYCTGQRVLIGINDLQTCNPKLASEWHPTKNGNLTPLNVTKSSSKKVWWLCNEGHEWKTTINHRNNHNCPYCYKEKKSQLPGLINLQTYNSELALEWHPTKNGELTPLDVSRASRKKVWWQCNKGHEWQARVTNRSVNNTKCPYCAGQRVLLGINDLQTCNPKLASEWHPIKNGKLTPLDVTKLSSKKVWWQCSNGHEWEARVSDRTGGHKCPTCYKLNRKKMLPKAKVN